MAGILTTVAPKVNAPSAAPKSTPKNTPKSTTKNTPKGTPKEKILRTAAYCRVSTDLEEQEGSYDTQMAYYKDKINADPTMELAGLYGDRGKSGLKAKSRPGFQRLISDCEAGKIDLILTKSISRFARNMADCVDLIQKLRNINVVISFEREGLRTDNRKTDLFMNIFAALAQEESHSISQNMTRSYEQCVLEGKPSGRGTYGYVRSGEDRWQIDHSEAIRVRTAFNMAAEGKTYNEIRAALNDIEEREKTGVVWLQRRVKHMLTNVTYLGDYYSHATVCLTPGHQVVNRGYRDRYYIEEHHEPLVSRGLFDRVQEIVNSGSLISYMPRTPSQLALIGDMSWRFDAPAEA